MSRGSDGAIRPVWCRGRATIALLVAIYLLICLSPHLGRLARPSLFSDDVGRVVELQTMPLGSLLARPFNEHVAPLFDLVSWATWQLEGRRLTRAPSAFTTASVVPFWLCLVALGILVRQESESSTVALAAVAIFSLSTVHIDAAWWYSASSFAWALLGTLLGWLCVLRSLSAERLAQPARAVHWRVAAAFMALTAPAFSAIGLLAGPVTALRAILDSRRTRPRWASIGVKLVPLAGTVVYLLIASRVNYHGIVADSVERKSDLPTALLCTLRAPVDVLASGLIGLDNSDRWLGGGADLVMGTLFLVGSLAWGMRRQRRPLVLCGLSLMVGGYGMTFSVRNAFGPHWLLEVQRYHLFPQLGFVLVLTEVLRPWLVRFDRRPHSALLVATALAALLLAVHRPMFQRRARTYHFPDQVRTMRALERLDALCREYRITRLQALTALDPIRTQWYSDDNALMMLPDSVSTPGLSDDRVRPTLMSALSQSEREALCGGMDASPYLRPAGESSEADAVAIGRLVDSFGASRIGPRDRFLARGPAYLEFQMSDVAPRAPIAEARRLCVPTSVRGGRIEVWWAGEGAEWSRTRSVRWRADPESPTGPWAVPLDRLPHWLPSSAARIRVLVRSASGIVEAPRLLR